MVWRATVAMAVLQRTSAIPVRLEDNGGAIVRAGSGQTHGRVRIEPGRGRPHDGGGEAGAVRYRHPHMPRHTPWIGAGAPAGRMFAFRRKRFFGSYFALTTASRS